MPSLSQAHVALGEITPVGSTSTIGAIHNVDPGLPNFTAAIRYYSSATGTPTVPGAGTVTITAKGLASDQYTSIANGALDATDVTNYVTWKHHCTEVVATPADITGATHYQLVVIQED